jgi:Zn-dependent protease/predicted transcriptional regulator
MFAHAWRIGRLAGIEIRIDVSWFVIAFLIAWSFSARFEFLYDDLRWTAAVALGAASAVVFFASVLAHELAHALVSKRRGVEVAGITLFLFGGVTETELRTERPADEFAITAVGPATSFALAGVLWGFAVAIGDLGSNPVAGAIGYLGWLNLVLGIFNLVPGLPLDGGRILHSAVWRATGDADRATRIAAGAGQALGYGLIALGIVTVFAGGIGGLWFAAIGWFLAQAARAEDERRRVGRALEGATAADVMTAEPEAIAEDLTVEQAVDRYFLTSDHSAYPVRANGTTVGLITLRAVRRIPREERGARTVRQAATPLTDVATVAPREPMERVFECLADEEVNRVLVVEGERVVGIITPTDIARWARRREELGLA